MAKQLNVNLAFNADTSQAQAQIQALQQSLNNVGISTAKLPITKEIQEAQLAANQLKVAMNSAFNVDTGKIDLLKFNQSIQKSGTNLVEIRNRLMQIGPTGQQAFLSLAQSIASAEIPARRTSRLLGDLGTTLKNTVKWQFSSSMMHGFMGAVQSAYGYAKNLNQSLNDIRIVTGLSADEMDRFAIKANKAAKALNASTLDYTNASLIYYQQGLNDQQVQERTDVTVKMANVTGTTAEKVSQQMTAVWNNFDDGSKSLEYYADVMTALGAATASSTDEISQGLQKFAAVANTVGLSYEYATSALATITATTRESADSVGTALKTLFARIQGLKMGETLEDGVDLNKYSSALRTIGVEVLTANGDLREMDDILDDMGERWKTLTDAQKQSTAQAVAGVRQYTQLIALMDNWDFFQSNLGVANSATGTLQEQANIYAESWEAASKRVKAAAEAVYTDLLNDDFFIDVTNSIEKLLTVLDGFLDSIGGAKGLLFGLSTILLNTFSGKAAAGLENMVYNFKSFVGIAQKEAIHTQNYMNELAKQPSMAGQAQTATQPQPITVSTKTAVMDGERQILQTIAQQKEHMNEIQQQESQAIAEQTRLYGEQAIILAQKAEAAKASQEATRSELIDVAMLNGVDNARQAFDDIDSDIDFSKNIEREVQEVIQALEKGETETQEFEAKLKKLAESMDQAKNHGMGETTGKDLSHFLNSARRGKTDEAKQHGTKAIDSSRKVVGAKARESFKGMGLEEKQADDYVKSQRQVIDATDKATGAVDRYHQVVEDGKGRIQGYSNATMSLSEGMVKAASCISSASFALTQISNLGNIWSDETLTDGQKLLQTFTSLGMVIPMLINIFTNFSSITNALATSQNFLNTAATAYAATQKGGLATMTAENLAKQTGMSLDQAQVAIDNAKAIAKMKELGLTKAQIGAMTAEQLAEKTGMTLDQASIIIAKVKAGATLGEAMAEAGLTSSLWAQVAAWIAAHTSMSPVLAITLLLVAAVALLVLGFLAVVSVVKALKAASPEGQLKAAKEEAASLAESLADAEQAAQDLKAAFDGYDQAVAKLAECTEGTLEWQQALHDVNSEVLDLINKNPELATMTLKDANGNEILGADGKPQRAVTKDENGNLKIEDWARQELLAKSQQAILNVQGAKTMADQKVRAAQIKVDTKDLATEINRQSGTYANQADSEGNVTDVSSSIANYIANNAAKFQGMTREEQIADLQATFKDVSFNADLWADAIAESAGSMNALVASIDANTMAIKLENQTLVASALADNQAVQDSAYTSLIVDKVAYDEGDPNTTEDDKARYTAAYEAALAELKADGFGTKNLSKADGVNESARDYFKQYAEAAGITNYDLLDTTGTDANRQFVYNDGEQEVTVSLEKMLDVIANQKAQEQMELDAAETIKSLQAFEITNKDQKQLAEGLLNSGLGALTEDQKRAAQAAGGIESLLDPDTLKQMEGAFTALYGDEGADKLKEWLNGLNEQIENWTPGAIDAEAIRTEYDKVQKIISGIKFGDSISEEDFKALGEGAEAYFTRMSDGTYKLTGDANTFYNLINSQNRQKLLQGVQDSRDYAANLQNKKAAAEVALGSTSIDEIGQNQYDAATNGYDGNKVTDQINFALEMGTITQDEANTWLADLEDGAFDAGADTLALISDRASQAAAAYNGLSAQIDEANAATQATITTAYTSATSLEDLNAVHAQMQQTLGEESDLSYFYSQGLLSVAGAYSNAADEAAAYQQAINNGGDTATAEDELKAAINIGEAAQTYDLDADALETQAKQYQELYSEMDLTAEAAANLAIQQQRMEKGVSNLKDNWSDYSKILKKNEKGTTEYAKTITELTDIISDLVGANEDLELSSEFFEEASGNLELIGKAAQGDVNAINALGVAVAKDLVSQMEMATNVTWKAGNEIKKGLQKNMGDGTVWTLSEDTFNTYKNRVIEGLTGLQQAVADGSVKMGDTLSSIGGVGAASWADSLNQMAIATGMSVEDMNSMLNSMGVQANVTTTDVKTTTRVPIYETTTTIQDRDEITQMPTKVTTTTREIGSEKMETVTPVAQIDMGEGGSSPNITYAGTQSVGGGGGKGGGGGGGSKKEKAETVKKKDVVQRYKPIDDKLDKQSNVVDKASRAMDRMYGKSRISAMEKYNELLQEEIDLMEIKLAEAQEYLEIDEADLHQALADATKELKMTGLEFEIDENGLISNYDEVMNALYDKLNAAITSANADGNATEKEKEEIDKIQEQIDAVTEAIEQYDETRGIVQDLENEIAEQALEIYDNELENLSYSIELNLELSDDSLALIEFQLSQIEDNAFKAAESIALMTQKAGTIEEKMSKTRDALAQLTAMTLNGEYTEEQMDLIKQYRDELMSLAQEYAELREQVHEQVMTTFEAWREEMDRGISTIEHSGSVLESYKNITDLLGKSLSDSVSSELYSQFSQSIINNSMDQIEAARAAYAGIQEAQARAQAAYEDAVARGDTASAEMWKETLNDLNEQANEAQEAMLSAWEDALNAAVEQFEASVERAVEAFKKPFDDMSEKFSRQKETSDMFLKDYQEIYELSKLSRDINKSIDDTESLGGKKKLKGLLEEINKLQEDGVEMSQYDLEYLQKTYDLRMAEIELENAQNAKNTVRLSKDNEGNWSYVYTTNTDAVDQAQQKYEDALYSMQDLSSNYIDEMSEKLISTSQEMADALAALRVEDFASYEEYQAEVARVTEEYEAQLAAQEAELNKAIGNNKELYDTDWKNYSDATGYKISETDKFVTSFRDSLLGSLMESTTQTSNFMEVLAGSAQVLVNSLGANGQEYFANIGAIMEAAGSSTEGFSTDATAAINAASEASQAASESVQTMAEDMVTAFDTVADSVEAWQERYSIAITEALEDTEALVTSINDLNESLIAGNGVTVPPITTTTTTTGSNTGDNNTSTNTSTTNTNNTRNGNSNNKTESESLIEGNLLIVEFISQLLDANGDKSNIAILSESFSALLKEIEPEDFEDITKYQAAMEEINKQYIEAFNKITTAQDNKELYTGQWEALIEAIEANPQVLTDVIPEAMMPTISEIVEKISLNAQNMSLGIGSWAAQVIKDELIQTLQQDVSITAEFPNVVDHNEIEQALTELINTASQYANRKHYGES